MDVQVLNANNMAMMQKSMDFLWQKQTCILDNLSNVETPNYKRKYVTFEESLDEALKSAEGRRSTSADVRSAIADSEIEIHVAEQSGRMDENGVDLTEQSLELARNAYQLQFVMDSISTDYSILRSAIRG